MKKIITWLFADFIYSLYEFIGSKYCKFISNTKVFALFKNGVEIVNTRFEVTDPLTGLVEANPLPIYSAHFQLNGHATITAVPTDDIELRNVSGIATLASSDGQSVTASMNIEKVG